MLVAATVATPWRSHLVEAASLDSTPLALCSRSLLATGRLRPGRLDGFGEICVGYPSLKGSVERFYWTALGSLTKMMRMLLFCGSYAGSWSRKGGWRSRWRMERRFSRTFGHATWSGEGR